MPSRRPGRAAAKRAAAALESTPKTFQMLDEDEQMLDADPEDGDAQPEPAQDDDNDNEDENENDEQSVGDGAEDNKNDSTSAKSPSPIPEPAPRRKRLGRPPKNRPPDWDQPTPQEREESTPRRRGRGGYRGRGGRKGQQPSVTQQPIDKDGNMVDIIDDEVALPEDPEGETKVDKLGNLQGGREYRCRTFTILGRGQRLYMLSTEPARCVGFRDSYLFFTKHRKLYKIIVDEDEKRDMIERDIIPHSYKGRSIGVVTARSVFREFGALIIVGGKRIIDDYEVAKAREEGVVEGELADPNDILPRDGEPYNKNQYVAWHGASAVYHQTGPAIPLQQVKTEAAKKRRVVINDVNWMVEHAREASSFNSRLSQFRAQNLKGVYDIHTNLKMYPAIMQPTHVKIEPVIDSEPPPTPSALFPPLRPKYARNYYVIDTYMETPKTGILNSAYETDDPNHLLAPYRGLSAVSDEVKDLLPPECRKAFDEALGKELEWKEDRRLEGGLTSRKQPKIDKAIVPYSVPNH